MTFLQKTLGKNYKWWYVMLFYHKRQTTYAFDNFMWIVATSVRLLGILYIWSNINQNNSKEIFTYLLLGNLFLHLTTNYAGFALGYDILSGKLANILLHPQPLVLYYFARTFGAIWYSGLMYLLLFSAVFAFNIDKFDMPDWQAFYLLPFLIIAICLKFLLEFLIGCLAFWFTQINNAVMALGEITNFLSGNLIPLTFLPAFTAFLPFAFLLHHPMQIYLGKYNPEETLLVFAGGIFWCVLLYFLAKIVFKMGLRKNESVGL